MGEIGKSKGPMLSRKEAADYITTNHFPVTAKTLATYASDGVGPPYRVIGGSARYRPGDIDAWVESPAHDGIVAPARAKG